VAVIDALYDLHQELVSLVSHFAWLVGVVLTYRCAFIDEERHDKEEAKCTAAERAEKRKNAKAAAQQKAAQRQQAHSKNREQSCKFCWCFVSPCTCSPLFQLVSEANRVSVQDPNATTGPDPAVRANSCWEEIPLTSNCS
jgi:hypothetical protein